jgi:hypothetical protein
MPAPKDFMGRARHSVRVAANCNGRRVPTRRAPSTDMDLFSIYAFCFPNVAIFCLDVRLGRWKQKRQSMNGSCLS